MLILLAVAVAVLAGLSLARVSSVPAPVLYALAGLAVSYAPGMDALRLPPHVVFYGFLPPLLYHAAFFTSPRETRAHALPIATLAVGLVLATLLAVGWVVAALVGALNLAAGFVLGAVLGPTDPVAATAVIRRVGAPERLQAVLEGESLVNDGVGLVAFALALRGALSGSFSYGDASLRFLLVAGGGVALGLVLGLVVAWIRRRVHDAEIEIFISLLTPYVAYVPAERAGVSGVLAVVACGVFLGWRSGGIFRPEVRLQSTAFWNMLDFLLTSVLFVLLGMQFPSVVGALGAYAPLSLAWYALVTFAVVALVRMAWMFTVPYAIARLPGERGWREVSPWRDRFVLGWSGMRGAVSLAAALSITGALAQRELVLFLTFTTILGGLVLQAIPLPWLLRRLRLGVGEEMSGAEARARLRLAQAALERLDALAAEDWVAPEFVDPVRALYEQRLGRFEARLERDGGGDHGAGDYRRLQRELIDAQRQALAELAAEGRVSTGVERRIERELDLEQARVPSRP
ncbi:MAG TPA: Na+/H+ antiporter [Gaiellaceae bacterium]|nr:Na+/H+ antiporter [Gaiellaceae bacterium]